MNQSVRISLFAFSLGSALAYGCSAEPERPSRPNSSSSSSSSTTTTSSSSSSSGNGSSSSSSTSSSGSGGSGMGGAGGFGGSGGGGEGGAGGTGMGGSGTGGSGMGGSGTGGSGMGGAGTGGAGGTGIGGAGMGGSGMGGAGGSGGGGPTNILLALAAPSGIAGQFDPNSGFSAKNLNLNIHESSLIPNAGGALAAVRRNSMVPAENNELFWSAYMPAAGFSMPQQVGAFGFAADGPALSPLGFGALLTFLGTDNKHYFTQYNGMSFDAFGQIPGGLPGTQAFGPTVTTLAQSPNNSGVYAIYAGDNESLYYVQKTGLGSSFTFSSGIPSSPVSNTIVPSAIVDQNDDMLVFYVRKSDSRICMVKLITPQNAFSAEEVLHPNAITAGSPAVAKTSAGDYLIAWHGFNNNGIYFLRGKEGMWGAPVTVIQPNAQTSLPAVQSGLPGAEADIVFGLDTHIQLARIGSANSINILQGPDTLVPVTHVSATLISP